MRTLDWPEKLRAIRNKGAAPLIRSFADEVNRRAEAEILSGRPMTGAHMRAILEVLKEIEE